MDFYQFSPFGSSAGALAVGPMAADQADFDGDGNADLWFLGDGANGAEISVHFANTAEVGRFRARQTMASTPFRAAATYRTTTSTVDHILAVNPDSDQPTLLHWIPSSPQGDPRDGYLGGSASGWITGLGTREVVTGDHAGDGHDDIMILRDVVTPNGSNPITEITLLEMGTQQYNFLWVENRISMTLGIHLDKLRILDLDGDKKTDFVANVPGFGVVAFRQTVGSFLIHGVWPTGSSTVHDIQIGDMDGNGLDDIAVVFDQGIFAIRYHQGHPSFPMGVDYRVYLNPAQVGSLYTCRILPANATNTTLLIGLPKDGRNYVIHPDNPGAYGLTQPWVETAPASLSGAGVAGISVITADVDNDRDPDLVIQAPDATRWMTLRNAEVSFKPLSLDGIYDGPAPPGEGDSYTVSVTVPQALVDEGALFAEIGFYVEDPTTNPNDPDYLYWGRLLPAINPFTNKASFTAYHWGDAEFAQQVTDFKTYRHINNGNSYVYPPSMWETIRTGRRMFLSVHGVDGSKRYESSPGKPPPKKVGSTLGGKWVLTAKPPSLKGDVELLPWE